MSTTTTTASPKSATPSKKGETPRAPEVIAKQQVADKGQANIEALRAQLKAEQEALKAKRAALRALQAESRPADQRKFKPGDVVRLVPHAEGTRDEKTGEELPAITLPKRFLDGKTVCKVLDCRTTRAHVLYNEGPDQEVLYVHVSDLKLSTVEPTQAGAPKA